MQREAVWKKIVDLLGPAMIKELVERFVNLDGWTYKDMASECGVSYSYLREAISRGRVGPRLAEKILPCMLERNPYTVYAVLKDMKSTLLEELDSLLSDLKKFVVESLEKG